MADCITAGLTINCNQDIKPGVDKVWVIDKDDVTDFDIDASQNISAITLVATKTFKEPPSRLK